MTSAGEEAERLRQQWREIAEDPSEWIGPNGEDREQEAYDTLMDYVDAHGLDRQTYDPRPETE